jgi:hypothetical protein
VIGFRTLWATLATVIGIAADRVRGRQRVDPAIAEPSDAAATDQAKIDTSPGESRTFAEPERVAQVLDHCGGDTRPAKVVAYPVEAKRGVRVLRAKAIDGGTSWTIRPPPSGWPEVISRLRGHAKAGHRSCEVADQHGELVSLEIEWQRGELVVSTGMVRASIRTNGIELQVTALAVETEGLERWVMREVPRWVFWSRAVELDAGDWRMLERLLADMGGFNQRRIEACTDMVGLPLHVDLAASIIARPDVTLHRRGDVWTGFDVGHRSSNEMSMGIYDKDGQLAACRGPEKSALLACMREAGLERGEDWTRIELRVWGDALVLIDPDTSEVIVDATGPLAAMHDEIVTLLWVHGLTKYWIADASGGARRMRDNPVLPAWVVARDAAGYVQPFKARRSAERAQLDSITQHASDRLGQLLMDVEVIHGTQLVDQVGPRARAEVDRVLADPRALDRFRRARAKYSEIVINVGEVEQP